MGAETLLYINEPDIVWYSLEMTCSSIFTAAPCPRELHSHNTAKALLLIFSKRLRNPSQSDLVWMSLDSCAVILRSYWCRGVCVCSATIETDKIGSSVYVLVVIYAPVDPFRNQQPLAERSGYESRNLGHHCGVQGNLDPLTSEAGISFISPHWLQHVSSTPLLDLLKCTDG